MNRVASYLCFLATCWVWSACAVSPSSQTGQPASLPFQLKILTDSREKVLTQTLPWEEQMMGYFKVLQVGPANWQIGYSSWDNTRKDDYSVFLVYARSTDGKNWVKQIPGKDNNILWGTGHPQKDGIVEQEVFLEPGVEFKYKMINTAKDNLDQNRVKTFV